VILKLFTLPTVTLTADVAAPIYSTSLASSSITIQADPANHENIYVGGSGVTTSTGISIAPGGLAAIEPPLIRSHQEEIDISTIYVVGSSTGDKVRVSIMRRD
jgi:hypothetical protein